MRTQYVIQRGDRFVANLEGLTVSRVEYALIFSNRERALDLAIFLNDKWDEDGYNVVPVNVTVELT